MKSYYSHLSSRKEFGEKIDNTRKPILRSSAVFPVVRNENYTSRINFLGYWLIKRKIPEVHLLITLRDQIGNTLYRKSKIISSVQAFSITLNSLLNDIQIPKDENFIGSIETEFFTTQDMVFPYPALVLEYYNDEFNYFCH